MIIDKPAIMVALPLAVLLALISCGREESGNVAFTGTVDLSQAVVTGPVFLMVTNTDDPELIENDPMNSVLSVITVPSDGFFSVDLSEMGLEAGQKVYLVAFADNDYRGGIPLPTEGDFLGFYIDRENWNMQYELPGDGFIVIPVNRRVYDFQAEVRGILEGEAGNVILAAYAGDFKSMDYRALDVDRIVGFRRMTKPEGPVPFSVRILPYGNDAPMEGVYVLALYDRNGNGVPDGGDAVGFHTGSHPLDLPQRIDISAGTRSGVDIVPVMEIPRPSGHAITLEGEYTTPAGYDSDSMPISVVVAETDDPNLLFTDPLGAVKAFVRLEPGTRDFFIDLAGTDLVPGDRVMVIALWDRDWTGGFPDPTPGDRAGFYQNTDPADISFTVTLADGKNSVAPGGAREFAVNRVLYSFDSAVRFTLDTATPQGKKIDIPDGAPLIAVAVNKAGVTLAGRIADINYVEGYSRFAFTKDPDHVYTLPLFSAQDEKITTMPMMESYMVVLYDRDGDGKPTEGVDDVAAYWRVIDLVIVKFTVPAVVSLDASKEVNTLARSVKFLGKKYGDNLLF